MGRLCPAHAHLTASYGGCAPLHFPAPTKAVQRTGGFQESVTAGMSSGPMFENEQTPLRAACGLGKVPTSSRCTN